MLANNYGKYFLKTSSLYFSKIKLVKLVSNLISVQTKTTEIDATNFWLSLETISVNNLHWENLHYACSAAQWDQKISSVAFKFSYYDNLETYLLNFDSVPTLKRLFKTSWDFSSS